MLFSVLILAQPAAAILPETVAGWVSLVLAVTALLGVAVAHGRGIERTNGVGERVGKIEEKYHRLDARLDAIESHRGADEAEVRHIRERLGELAAAVEMNGRREQDNKVEILQRVGEVGQELRTELGRTNENVAELRGALRAQKRVRSSE